MAINNNGRLLDQAGNVAVDFVWGNMPMQPNDVRPDVAPDATTTVLGQTVANNGRLSTTAATSKNTSTLPLSGWGAYPLFSSGTKDSNGFFQGEKGEFTGTAATATALANYAFNINFPEVKTLTTAQAQDAIKDAGVTGAITVTAAQAGGRANISNVARVVTTGVTTITTSAAHGFNKGDVVGISLSTADSGSLNGTWVITDITDTTNFKFVCSTTTAISSVGETTGDVHVIGTRTKPISAVQSVATGSAITINTQAPVVADGTNVTLTTASNHGLVVGQMVNVASVQPSGYQNATAQVTAVPSANTFTYANTTTGNITTAGTVTANGYMVITAPSHGFVAGDVVTTYATTDSNFTVDAKTVRFVPTYDGYVNGLPTKIANTDTFVLDSSAGTIASKEDVAGVAVAVSTVASAKKADLTYIKYPDANTLNFTVASHNYAVGDLVHLSKITTSAYTSVNDTQAVTTAITAVTPTSFTIAKSNSLASTGTVAVSGTAATGAAGVITYQSTKNPGVGALVSVTGLLMDVPTQTPVLNAVGSVTLTTSTAHGLTVGGYVTIATVAASSATPTSIYTGTYMVTGVPSTTSFTITISGLTTAYPITTAGTAVASNAAGASAGFGLNVSNATVVTSSGSLFTVSSPVVAVSNSTTAGTVTILGATCNGTSYVAVKTGTVKTQSVAKGLNSQAITVAPTITTYN